MVEIRKRGQAAVMDLFVAISVFIILTTILTLTWDLYNIRINNRFTYDDMVLKTLQISDILVRTQGIPPDFVPQSAQSIGLARRDYTLDNRRVARVAAMNESDFKNIMKINLYEFYLVVRDQSGAANATLGKPPAGKSTVNLLRYVMYDGRQVGFEFSLWK